MDQEEDLQQNQVDKIERIGILPMTVLLMKRIIKYSYQKSVKEYAKIKIKFMTTVARAVYKNQLITLNDGTDVLIDIPVKAGLPVYQIDPNLYYRFNSHGVHVVGIKSVAPNQLIDHFAQVMQLEIQKVFQDNNINAKRQKVNFKQKQLQDNVKRYFLQFKSATCEELQNRFGKDREQIEKVLDRLCMQAIIGNFGVKYVLIQFSEDQEGPQDQKMYKQI